MERLFRQIPVSGRALVEAVDAAASGYHRGSSAVCLETAARITDEAGDQHLLLEGRQRKEVGSIPIRPIRDSRLDLVQAATQRQFLGRTDDLAALDCFLNRLSRNRGFRSSSVSVNGGIVKSSWTAGSSDRHCR